MTPLRWLPRFRRAYAALDTLAEREQWSRTSIEDLQLDRLNAVWAHAVAHVPHYRTLAATSRLPPRFTTLAEFRMAMPLLPRELVKDQPRSFLSERPERGNWRLTGGSTGVPMRVYWSHRAHLEMLQAKYRFHDAWGVDIFDPAVYLWGRGAPGRRQLLEDRLRRRLRLSAYFLDDAHLAEYLARIEAFGPSSIYSYSTAAYLLAMAAERRGVRCDTLKLFTMTSEPAFPAIVRTVERAFGVPAVVEYGSVDCGFTAAEYPDRTLHVREDLSIVETLRRDDGRFDLVVTVLNNPSFPLIRYAIGDVSDAPMSAPAHGFGTLANVAGRVNDLAVTRTGQLVHFSWFDAFFQATRVLRRWQVRQASDGSVAVLLELEPGEDLHSPDELAQRLSGRLGGFPVTLSVVDAIPQTIAGKHRWVASELYGHRLAA